MDDGALTFEQAFHQLQAMVEQLEEGGLPLEEAVALFERGMRLVGLCTGHLDQVELRVLEIEGTLGQALARDEFAGGPFGAN